MQSMRPYIQPQTGAMSSFLLVLVALTVSVVDSFSFPLNVVAPSLFTRTCPSRRQRLEVRVCRLQSHSAGPLCMSTSSSSSEHDNTELAWRYAKKPLLRIGSKGATLTHGNSLRQLLESHTAVKVKVNTRKFGTMEHAFEVLRDLCEEAGGPKGIELLQAREGDKIILFGMPGTLQKIASGDFPPPVVEQEEEEDE